MLQCLIVDYLLILQWPRAKEADLFDENMERILFIGWLELVRLEDMPVITPYQTDQLLRGESATH